MAVSTSTRYKGLLLFIGAVFILYFFWNVTLYSERICEKQLLKADEERDAQLSTLRSELLLNAKKLEDLQKELNSRHTKIPDTEPTKPTDVPPVAPPPLPDRATQVTADELPIIPLLIFTYNRANYLNDTLAGLLRSNPPSHFPIIVSQDGRDEQVFRVLESYPRVMHLEHVRHVPTLRSKTEKEAYYYISDHYRWALGTVFDKLQYDAVIILEDDMYISPDFFSYFQMGYDLLKSDPSLLCVSAWNDNGQPEHVKDPYALRRSNFFPGLGWLMLRSVWDEFKDKWPNAYWDDWIREPDQRRGRDCIHPEISRTKNFGKHGSSEGQYFDKFVGNNALNTVDIDWSKQKVDYLRKDRYDKYIFSLLKNATSLSHSSPTAEIEKTKGNTEKTFVLWYKGIKSDYKALADKFEIMRDEKAGVPRTGYMGVVMFWYMNHRVLLAPSELQQKI